MDDLERRKAFEAAKQKAIQAKLAKEQQAMADRKLMYMRFNHSKTAAATDHALRVLESWRGVKGMDQIRVRPTEKRVENLTQIDNRPAEKLVRGRTKGMKKRSPGGGPSI